MTCRLISNMTNIYVPPSLIFLESSCTFGQNRVESFWSLLTLGPLELYHMAHWSCRVGPFPLGWKFPLVHFDPGLKLTESLVQYTSHLYQWKPELLVSFFFLIFLAYRLSLTRWFYNLVESYGTWILPAPHRRASFYVLSRASLFSSLDSTLSSGAHSMQAQESSGALQVHQCPCTLTTEYIESFGT